MRTSTIVLAILALLGIIVAVYAYTKDDPESVVAEPTSFAECAVLYPVMESYPRQCNTPSGLHFTEEVPAPVVPVPSEAAIEGLIEVDRPVIDQAVASPLNISGRARGYWFFEATFPIELQDAAGNVIAEHYAEAEGEWMTEEFVPYTASLTYPAQPAGSEGSLVLRRSNASGDPERDQELVIPVSF
ncbi:MAG TPA: Gmad2 immunoglobulin-like domain-containing protein [Candidatus Paceibacterota bacterium]|nr:Gmad2 immunoglobulin-like domain-containing protein [Candidatus Paceibacterota bacterium]